VRRLRVRPKTPPGDGAVRMVYLLKQGTFYPSRRPDRTNAITSWNCVCVPSSVTTFRWRRISRAGWRSGTSRSPSERTRRSRCRLSNQALRRTRGPIGSDRRGRGSTVQSAVVGSRTSLGVMVEPFGERHLRLQESNAARVVSRPDVTNQCESSTCHFGCASVQSCTTRSSRSDGLVKGASCPRAPPPRRIPRR